MAGDPSTEVHSLDHKKGNIRIRGGRDDGRGRVVASKVVARVIRGVGVGGIRAQLDADNGADKVVVARVNVDNNSARNKRVNVCDSSVAGSSVWDVQEGKPGEAEGLRMAYCPSLVENLHGKC